jgi:hypothetical protein
MRVRDAILEARKAYLLDLKNPAFPNAVLLSQKNIKDLSAEVGPGLGLEPGQEITRIFGMIIYRCYLGDLSKIDDVLEVGAIGVAEWTKIG